MNSQLAREAALSLRESLPRCGKMFGVLVARSGDVYVTLKAFSGMLDGKWHVDGFVGPAFNDERLAFEASEAAAIAAAENHRELSQQLMKRIHDTYVMRNARGETKRLRELFAPYEQPAGAGDCAAPKLLQYAFANGLEPVSLAEFFWGEGPREHGEFYAPCDKKCAPILAFMLNRPPLVPRVVYEDDAMIVVDKPAGLLSVPGRSALPSVQSWLGSALLAHRLDQDTSGLLVAGKTPDAYKHLQRQFGERKVHKEYVAILEKPFTGSGTITLALRPDIDDRPRQIHDPAGYDAVTEWSADGTRVTFRPLTGRTHQLRVHAKLALAPIKGDRLYGRASDRLYLHAARLGFTHPAGGQVAFESALPWGQVPAA